MTNDAPPATPQVGSGHYLALCSLCLAVIFLVQLQQGLLLINALSVAVGTLGLVMKMRQGPMMLVLFVVGAQLSLRPMGVSRRQAAMELTDIALCAAVLGYVVAHFRLQGIWYNLLPTDPRLRGGAPRRVLPWLRWQAPVLEEKRPAGQITPQEIAWLLAMLPIWAVAAQLVWALIPKDREPLAIPLRLAQTLLLYWLLAMGYVVVRAMLTFWKHRAHDPATAQLFLQDALWRDTRGEQRRLNRWLAWWKLARKKKTTAEG